MITLGLVDSVDDNGVYVTMPGSKGVLRGPYKALSTVAAGTTVLVASTDDGEQVVVGPAPGVDGAISVVAFGAKGDGVADDTDAVQSAIDAAGAVAGTVVIPPGTFKITAALTVSASVTITGSGTIHQTTSAHGLNITADSVTVDGVTLTGRHSGAVSLDLDENAINAVGTSAASPLRRLTVRNVTVAGWGMHGVYLKWVNSFQVSDADLERIGYGAVVALSCKDGLIADCRISDIGPGDAGNMYGVGLSREDSDSLSTDPRCSDITVRGNVVSDVAWEGLDTHGGQRITFADNVVRGCLVGIAVVGSDDASNVTQWAPLDCVVSGNVIDSGVSDGSAGAGVAVAGASGATSSDPATEYATAVVADNVIRGHGTEDNNISGAVYCRNTKGLVISNNTIFEGSPFGVCLYYDNIGFVAVGNTFVDAWSTSVTSAAAIGMRDENNTGLIANCTLSDGSKSATYRNVYGALNSVGAAGGCDVVFGLNHFGVASAAYSWLSGLVPEITGSRGGNAALASLLTALDSLGIIGNSTT